MLLETHSAPSARAAAAPSACAVAPSCAVAAAFATKAKHAGVAARIWRAAAKKIRAPGPGFSIG
jgi:hypothetical protein